MDNEILILSPTETLYSKTPSGRGFNIQGGKFITSTLEPTFRFTYLSPNSEVRASRGLFMDQTRYEIGLNNFFLGHALKIQGQLGYIHESYAALPSRHYLEFIVQFAISF